MAAEVCASSSIAAETRLVGASVGISSRGLWMGGSMEVGGCLVAGSMLTVVLVPAMVWDGWSGVVSLAVTSKGLVFFGFFTLASGSNPSMMLISGILLLWCLLFMCLFRLSLRAYFFSQSGQLYLYLYLLHSCSCLILFPNSVKRV